MTREFTYDDAVLREVPLSVGIAGFSGAGKTKSALEVASGIQSVRGGDIAVIDTESRRAAHYANKYRFKHIPFAPPFGPDRYQAAIKFAHDKGARIIVVDNMSHEHDGEGGVLDQIERYLDDKCGNDVKARERNLMVASIKPKRARKTLNLFVEQLADVAFVFTYRAEPKVKPVKGQGVVDVGMSVISTSNLIYQMTLRVLLRPGADGVPTILGDTPGESMLVKSNEEFREWPELKRPVSKDLGVRLAHWATGTQPALLFHPKFPTWGGKPVESAPDEVIVRYAALCEKNGNPDLPRVEAIVAARTDAKADAFQGAQ